VASVLAGGGLLRPRALAEHDRALRVALVQTAACLLAGDQDELDIRVGPGAALELVEPAATVAHHGRDGRGARWSARVTVEAGATLRWLGAPFIVAAGATVERSLRVDVADGGAALLRDLLVLGRATEAPGAYAGHTELRHAGRPLLVEALDTSDRALLRSPAVLGDAKVLDTIALVGRVPPPAPDTWRLPGAGAMRALPFASAHEADAASAALLRAWSLALDGGGEVGDEVLGGFDPAREAYEVGPRRAV
jgi:urease accessory protein